MKILVGESNSGKSTVMSLVSAPYTTSYTAEELYKQAQEEGAETKMVVEVLKDDGTE
jgi:dephospho-CoA kinase